jgi:hypothetical protein
MYLKYLKIATLNTSKLDGEQGLLNMQPVLSLIKDMTTFAL